MQNRKKIIATTLLITIVLIVAMSALCGCVNHLEDEVVIGDFVCQTWESNNTIHLKDLSEEGKKKKYIVVPQELNGMKVSMLGYRNAIFSPGAGCWESENLEKLFIVGEWYQLMSNIFGKCSHLSKIVFISDNIKGTSYYDGGNRILLINSNNYFSRNTDHNQDEKPNFYAANISYYYNYEDAPNAGYYWLDDVENGELIEFIPEEPTREGYKFEGWYKEAECINEWDFATDKVPKADYYADFIENKLFAKWVKE